MPSLDSQKSWEHAAASRTMVLATLRPDGFPHLVPVCHVIVGRDLYFAIDQVKAKTTQRLQRLANIAQDPRVSLLASSYDDGDWGRLWWVRIDGTASEVSGPERRLALAALSERFAQYAEHGPDGPVVRIRPSSVVGWSA